MMNYDAWKTACPPEFDDTLYCEDCGRRENVEDWDEAESVFSNDFDAKCPDCGSESIIVDDSFEEW